MLTPFLPPKHEYVVSVRLSDVQVKLYQFYMKHFTGQQHSGSQLFLDWQALGRIWTHPRVLMWCTEKAEKELEKKVVKVIFCRFIIEGVWPCAQMVPSLSTSANLLFIFSRALISCT